MMTFKNPIDSFLEIIKNPPGYLITSLGIMLLIGIFAVVVGKKIENMDAKAKPTKLLTVVIEGIGGFNKFVKGYVGKHWTYITPVALTMAIYVFISNISGIFGLPSPTKYTAITFSMSLLSFIVVQSTGIISVGAKHFLGIFKPLWPMFPLNIVSEFVPILSMALRLFGNIAGGALIMTLVYGVTSWAGILIAPAFHLIFDIGFGLIQTVVIVLLTVIFAAMKVDEADLVV